MKDLSANKYETIDLNYKHKTITTTCNNYFIMTVIVGWLINYITHIWKI